MVCLHLMVRVHLQQQTVTSCVCTSSQTKATVWEQTETRSFTSTHKRGRRLSTAQTPPSEREPGTPLHEKGKQEKRIPQNESQMHYSGWSVRTDFTYSEERSHGTQLYWVLSRGTCDSFWNQIPFYQWTRSCNGETNTKPSINRPEKKQKTSKRYNPK